MEFLGQANAAQASPNYKVIDENFALDGKLEENHLQFLKGYYKSILYLCSDTINDKCAYDGFHTIQFYFSEAKGIPLDSKEMQYQKGCSADPFHCIHTFKRFEEALDSLPRPTVISCKSATRASAVYCAYKAVKEGLTVEEILHVAKSRELKFSASEGLVEWLTTVVDSLNHKNSIIFRQLYDRETCAYSYLLADSLTMDAVIIDPVYSGAGRDYQLVKDLHLSLKYVLNTHIHADHITGSGKLKVMFNRVPQNQDDASVEAALKSVLPKLSFGNADVQLKEYDTIEFGSRKLYTIYTPGHTSCDVSFVLDDFSAVFTGDSLLIRGCGRTDLQGGNASKLYQSVHNKLFDQLPGGCTVYPGHDYQGHTQSTIAEEKVLNPMFTIPEGEFVEAIKSVRLPEVLDEAIPANLVCGIF